MNVRTKITLLAVPCLLLLMSSEKVSISQTARLPNPVLVFMLAEPATTGGNNIFRYKFTVDNFSDYPNAMFAAAPTLPPCGANTNSSRTWVDIFDSRGKRLNGFCALGKPADMNGIWFALPETEIPPSYVYIEMTDRQTGTKYKSNLADTVQ